MSKTGASKLQKIIKVLQAKGSLKFIACGDESESVVWIEKRTSESDNRTEFKFRFRKEAHGLKETWWPISYNNIHGETISCETQLNGKVLTNLLKQDSLIELAESWAKSLEAELVVNTVENALR